MNTRELATNPKSSRRVMEAEVKLPKLDEIEWPKVDLEPARDLAEQVLLTGIGLAVLVARGVIRSVNAARQAGLEAAESPGPITKALLSLVRKAEDTARGSEARVIVPILPIDDYDELEVAAILERLPDLSADQLGVLREYEASRQARDELLEALDQHLATN